MRELALAHRVGNAVVSAYSLAIKGIKAAQQALGMDRVSALMTTTEASLDRIEDIVDEQPG